MDPCSRLAAIGVALYGPRWQRSVARDLGVFPKQVARWLYEGYVPSERQIEVLVKAARQRRDDIDAAIAFADGPGPPKG